MRSTPVCFFLLFVSAFSQTSYQAALDAQKQGRFADAERLFKQALQQSPKAFNVNYSFGLFLLQTKRPAEALERFNAASLAEPNRFEPYVARANAHLDLGRPENALKALEKGESVCGRSPEYWLMRGQVELMLGHRGEAVSAATKAADLASANPEMLFNAGRFLIELHATQRGLLALRTAVSLDPKNSERALQLSQILLETNAFDEALAIAAKVESEEPRNTKAALLESYALESLSRPKDAMEAVNRALERGCSKAPLKTRQAELFIASADAKNARTALDEALEADPAAFRALVLRSELKLQAGDPRGAAVDASKAAGVSPHSSDGYRAACRAFSALGFSGRLEACLRSWSQNCHAEMEPLPMLGKMLADRKDHKEAAAVFAKWAALDPKNVEPVERLASSLLADGQAEEAVVRLQRAIESGVESPTIHLDLALAFRQTGENAKAISALQRMQAKYPKDMRAWLLEANTRERFGGLESALNVYRTVCEKFPNEPAGWQGSAVVLAKMNKHLQSAEAWEQLYAKFPKIVGALIGASEEYRAAGRPDEYKRLFENALKTSDLKYEVASVYAGYLFDQKRFSDAEVHYAAAWSLDKKEPVIFERLVECMIRQDKFAEAAEKLKSEPKLLSVNANLLQTLHNVQKKLNDEPGFGAYLISVIESKQFGRALLLTYVDFSNGAGKLADAITRLRTLANDNPAVGDIWFALSRANALRNDAAQALDCLERAADCLSTDQAVLRTFAAAAESERDSIRAAKAFGYLSNLLKDDSGLLIKHAAYLLEAGNRSEAKSVLQEGALRFPGVQEIADMLKKIGDAR